MINEYYSPCIWCGCEDLPILSQKLAPTESVNEEGTNIYNDSVVNRKHCYKLSCANTDCGYNVFFSHKARSLIDLWNEFNDRILLIERYTLLLENEQSYTRKRLYDKVLCALKRGGWLNQTKYI
jgi:hypothetical protein